jgi:uncharacterized protein (TIGR03089 family)
MELARIAAPLAVLTGDAVAGVDPELLTYCDDATGERTELTAAELGGWAGRAASLLRDGCGLKSGDRAAVLLPPHWQTAAVLLGAWSIGVAVSYRAWATAGLAPPDPTPWDAVFVARSRLDSWLEAVPAGRHRFVLGLAAGDAALDEVPTGYRDFAADVRRYPDSTPAYWEIGPAGSASPDGTTYEEWAGLAHGYAATLGLKAGDRLLVDIAEREQPVMWLLAPLSVGASVVLCANLDRDRINERAAAEGATHVLS